MPQEREHCITAIKWDEVAEFTQGFILGLPDEDESQYFMVSFTQF